MSAARKALKVLEDKMADDISALDELIQFERQLHAARYTYHRQMIHKYGNHISVQNHGVEQAAEMYRLAMENYDGIIEAAANGHSHDANEADMKEGFKL